MGNELAKHSDKEDRLTAVMDQISDVRYTVNYMEDGECGRQFLRGLYECHPAWDRGAAAAVEECARATEALLECMKRRPEHFSAYIRRVEEGLDQDLRPEKPSSTDAPAPWEIRGDFLFDSRRFRWWKGMRRAVEVETRSRVDRTDARASSLV